MRLQKYFPLLKLTACTLATASCAVIAPPHVEDKDLKWHEAMDTFANKPLCEKSNLEGATPDDRCALATKPGAKLAASTYVPWNYSESGECRIDARKDGGKTPPSKECLDHDFVSISISGGGTKSAVFSAEALFSLEKWGLLSRADVLSSVSGGSFTAGLYALSEDASSTGRLRPEGWKCPDPTPSESRGRGRNAAPLRWEYCDIMNRAEADLLTPLMLRRFNPVDLARRGATFRNVGDVLAETIDYHLFDGTNKKIGEINPRKPNIVFNASNISTNRSYLESESFDDDGATHLPRKKWRRKTIDEHQHFSFTDYYFERLLKSELSSFPVSLGIATSAAFPLTIDPVTLARYRKSSKAFDIDYVHLMDGGANDNHGLTEVRMMLRDAVENNPSGHSPRRIVALMLDASLNASTGEDHERPTARHADSLLGPLRIVATSNSVDRIMNANAEMRRPALAEQLAAYQRDKKGMVARLAPISIELLHRVEQPEDETAQPHEVNPKRSPWTDAPPKPTDRAPAMELVEPRSKAAVKALLDKTDSGAELRRRYGLSNIHPQCYYETLISVPTNYNVPENDAACLRHAARWATAIRMMQLCRDPALKAAGAGGAPLINCSLTEEFNLPTLPACVFEDKMQQALETHRATGGPAAGTACRFLLTNQSQMALELTAEGRSKEREAGRI